MITYTIIYTIDNKYYNVFSIYNLNTPNTRHLGVAWCRYLNNIVILNFHIRYTYIIYAFEAKSEILIIRLRYTQFKRKILYYHLVADSPL